MDNQQTLSIIKPDSVKSGYIGSINSMIEDAGIRILKKKKLTLTINEASEFYSIHKDFPLRLRL